VRIGGFGAKSAWHGLCDYIVGKVAEVFNRGHVMRNKSRIIATALCVCAVAASGSTAFAQAAADSSVKSPAADNTSVNKRDKSPDTIKVTDQPNNSADIHVAAAVRKAIVDDKSLSTLAHNVKLVAANGTVTLRGPVNSSSEKAKVGQIVASISGVSSVDNQLDVKTQ
jgi:hyperosmotically inducible periplasmic protein